MRLLRLSRPALLAWLIPVAASPALHAAPLPLAGGRMQLDVGKGHVAREVSRDRKGTVVEVDGNAWRIRLEELALTGAAKDLAALARERQLGMGGKEEALVLGSVHVHAGWPYRPMGLGGDWPVVVRILVLHPDRTLMLGELSTASCEPLDTCREQARFLLQHLQAGKPLDLGPHAVRLNVEDQVQFTAQLRAGHHAEQDVYDRPEVRGVAPWPETGGMLWMEPAPHASKAEPPGVSARTPGSFLGTEFTWLTYPGTQGMTNVVGEACVPRKESPCAWIRMRIIAPAAAVPGFMAVVGSARPVVPSARAR